MFDTHWLVNADYHINCAPHFKGVYTSNELPHFISNMAFELDGNPALGVLMAEVANAHGITTRAHPATTLAPEYGTLVPMRYMCFLDSALQSQSGRRQFASRIFHFIAETTLKCRSAFM